MEKKLFFCPVCNSKKNIILYKSNFNVRNPYNKFLINEVFENSKKISSNLRICLNCSLCFFDYRYTKNELNKLYSKQYTKKRAKYIEGFQNNFVRGMESYKSRASLIRKLIVHEYYFKFRKWKSKAQFLDFGGWHGENIPDIAIETNKYILDKSKHKTSSNVKVINKIEKDQKFDLIMSTNVFEHLINPLDNLKVLNSSLKKDGLIYLELPVDILGLLRKTPICEHINFFSRNSIMKLASLAGLKVISIKILKYPYSYRDTIAYIVTMEELQSRLKSNKIKIISKISNIFKDIIDYSIVKLSITQNLIFKQNSKLIN